MTGREARVMAVYTPGLERGGGASRGHSPYDFGPIGAPLRGRGNAGAQRPGLAASRHNRESRGYV